MMKMFKVIVMTLIFTVQLCCGAPVKKIAALDEILRSNSHVKGLDNGDVILSNEQRKFFHSMNSTKRSKRSLLKKMFNQRWPEGVVPYTIDALIRQSSDKVDVIHKAMKRIESVSCIRFEEYETYNAPNAHVAIVSESGCWSYVGRTGYSQKLSLSVDSCLYTPSAAIHELLHALGFFHEQSRQDRDGFIKIVTENIREGFEGNFDKQMDTYEDGLGVKYDYYSIMHYGPYAFSKDAANGKATILTNKGEFMWFGGNDLSEKDIEQLNLYYECSGTRTDTTTTTTTTTSTTTTRPTTTSTTTPTTPITTSTTTTRPTTTSTTTTAIYQACSSLVDSYSNYCSNSLTVSNFNNLCSATGSWYARYCARTCCDLNIVETITTKTTTKPPATTMKSSTTTTSTTSKEVPTTSTTTTTTRTTTTEPTSEVCDQYNYFNEIWFCQTITIANYKTICNSHGYLCRRTCCLLDAKSENKNEETSKTTTTTTTMIPTTTTTTTKRSTTTTTTRPTSTTTTTTRSTSTTQPTRITTVPSTATIPLTTITVTNRCENLRNTYHSCSALGEAQCRQYRTYCLKSCCELSS